MKFNYGDRVKVMVTGETGTVRETKAIENTYGEPRMIYYIEVVSGDMVPYSEDELKLVEPEPEELHFDETAEIELPEVEEKPVIDVKDSIKASPMLSMEPVKPKSGGFIKDKPFDVQPVLERISILQEVYKDFENRINATDTSMITGTEIAAFNQIALEFEKVNEKLLELAGR